MDTVNLPRRGQRFREPELREMVRRQCEAEWIDFAGQPWTEQWRTYFDTSDEHTLAVARHDQYSMACSLLVSAVKRARDVLEAHRGGDLIIVEELLNDDRWRVFDSNVTHHAKLGPPRMSPRTQFVVEHHIGAFLRHGHRATLRELTVVSLLIGNFPEGMRIPRDGLTVAAVMAAESRAVDRVRVDWPAIGDRHKTRRKPKRTA